MLNIFNMKTITISDEVYAKLEQIKDGRSFSEVINQLITLNVSLRIDKLLELKSYQTGREDELLSLVEKIRKEFQARRP